MNRIKHIVKFLVFAALAVLLFVLGTGKNLFADNGLSLTWESVGRILLVIFAILAVEHLIILLLSLFNFKSHRARTVVTLLASAIRYIAVIAIVIGVLSLLQVDMPTILAGLGIIALIIGFGAESLITDVVTGFFILMDNQYNVGDIIEVGGFRGTVSEIGIRTTSLTDTGGNVKIINNSDMKNILNRSDNSSKAVADFSIPYETDLEKLEEKIPSLLEEIYNSNTETFKSAPKYLGVQELGDSAVVLRFVVEVGESDIYSGARKLNHDLFIGFRKLGVECPFQQVDVHSK
ncbi:MAG: mechanosensitive ion channel [Clostridia bacterium]|nr:mechanosensitive ion channel [Clostridia bacterium]